MSGKENQAIAVRKRAPGGGRKTLGGNTQTGESSKLNVKVPATLNESLRAHLSRTGESLSSFVRRAIEEKLEHEG